LNDNGFRNVLVTAVREDIYTLTMRQMAVFLCVYAERAPHTVTELARTLRVPVSVISRACDRLTEHGLLEREVPDSDRRRVVLRRTSSGETLYNRLVRAA
jgi:DNA-binding MarR family transcriptional regulator